MIELEQAFEADCEVGLPYSLCVSWSFCRSSVFNLHPPWFTLPLVCALLPLHSASFFPEIVCMRRLVDVS